MSADKNNLGVVIIANKTTKEQITLRNFKPLSEKFCPKCKAPLLITESENRKIETCLACGWEDTNASV